MDLHELRTLDAVSRYVLHQRPAEGANPFVLLVGGSGRTRQCEPLSYQAIARGFARRLNRLGIRTLEKTPHALRHTQIAAAATSPFSADQRGHHLPPRHPEAVTGHHRQLDLGVLQQLLHPLLLCDPHRH